MKTFDLLKRLTATPAVSGSENEMTAVLSDILSDFGAVEVDGMNNIRCTFGSGRHFLLDSHIDEIGMIVTGITDDGFLKVDKCGGLDCRMLPAAEVTVLGRENINGVISTLPPHLQSSGDKKVPKITDISIDIGMSRQHSCELVSPGDRVVFKKNFTPLCSSLVSSSALDDRAGVCAIILAAEKLKDVGAKITLLFSSQEEVGLRGAKTGAFELNADEAIAVDVSFGYSPSCKRSECGEIGKGPMIGFSPVLDKEIGNNLKKTAEDMKIPYQCEVMGGGHTGTNADVVSLSGSGIKTGLVSIPQRYMHSPIEVVDISDIENTAELIAAYITAKVGESNA